jgi:hypothetical protein
MKSNLELIYLIVLLIISLTLKYVPPFKTYHKLQKFTPLLIVFFVVPITVKFPLSSMKPVPCILAILLIIFSIWGVIKNFRLDQGNKDAE